MSSFALYSVPIAAGLAYLPHFAKVTILRSHAAYDNKDPRALSKQTKGLPPAKAALVTRLASAHTNQIEMLGFYAAGIAVGTAVGVNPATMTTIARMYVGMRAAYVASYAGPQVMDGKLRSLTFAGAFGATMWAWFAAAARLKK